MNANKQNTVMLAWKRVSQKVIKKPPSKDILLGVSKICTMSQHKIPLKFDLETTTITCTCH